MYNLFYYRAEPNSQVDKLKARRESGKLSEADIPLFWPLPWKELSCDVQTDASTVS